MSDAVILRLNAALEGRYVVERALGEGGMATVYLADDVRHGRKVAIKVLKPELAEMVGAERFLAEIRTTANLLHPHILPLHDSGEADGFLFFVSPYIDGETLRDRLDREKQLAVEEAVRIAAAVASALQAAHEQGVVHRDIKPANILLSRGEPLVADFGIALAVRESGGNRLTETGLSVGTPYYMSPEQATGDREVGARSDVYALGCVTYEMLVGDPPHVGSTAQAVLGKILTETPRAPAAVRPAVPQNVDGAVLKALEKLPADRFPTAEAFAKALADPSFRYGRTVEAGPTPPPGSGTIWKVATAVSTVAAVALAGVALRWRPTPDTTPVMYFDVTLPPSLSLMTGQGVNLDLSGDGSKIVFVGQDSAGAQALWLRTSDHLEPARLAGTNDPRSPRFSPDGKAVAYLSGASLRRASLDGAPTVTVVPDSVVGGRGNGGVAWGDDGFLYFSRTAGGLWRVPAGGGKPEVVRAADPRAVYSWFDVLPGSGVLLYSNTNELDPTLTTVLALDLRSGQVKSLLTGTMARFAPPASLLYATGQAQVLTVPFDPERMEVTGSPRPLLSGIQVNSGSASYFAVSASGALLYAKGIVGTAPTPVWISSDGQETPLPGIPDGANLRDPAISPDGTRIAFTRSPDVISASSLYLPNPSRIAGDIWIYETEAEGTPMAPLTLDGHASDPFWSPDGAEVGYRQTGPDGSGIDVRHSDFSGQPRHLVPPGNTEDAVSAYIGAWTPHGRAILYVDSVGRLVKAPVAGGGTPSVVLGGDVNATGFSVSPDGRWLAFASGVSGTSEIWVAPLSGGSGRTQVSVSGGLHPRWARDGKAVIYVDPQGNWLRADVRTSPDFAVTERRRIAGAIGFYTDFDVAPDGRILALHRGRGTSLNAHTMLLVTDWRRGLAGGG
ncbi:MAG: serine/threonine-protein kinase [Gemmatimonadetes bacterium]|nr:serine/threonine-protein kinase [Gemmatimonadota bacterium]